VGAPRLLESRRAFAVIASPGFKGLDVAPEHFANRMHSPGTGRNPAKVAS
jgi:hypothetical protein